MFAFTTAQINALNPESSISPLITTSKNLSSGTRSVTIANYSGYQLSIGSDTNGDIGILIPFSTKTYNIPNTRQLIFALDKAGIATVPVAEQYVDYSESVLDVETGLSPLALLPVYTSIVDIANTPSVNISGTTTVNIGNTPAVTISGTPSVNITGTPTVTLTGTNTVNVGNTPSVSISGTPNVSLVGLSNNVNIQNTPAVTVTSGTVSISGTPAVTVNSGSVNIANTPSVTVNNTSIKVSNDASGSLTVAGTVNIGGTPSVSISGTPAVTITSGFIQISNTPSVAISGTPAVTLFGSTNNVQIANTPAVTLSGTGNTVTVGNTPAVTLSGTNTVNIGNTPSVNVNNTNLQVTNSAGGSLTVGGTINIGNTPAVTISGTPNVAITSGTVNANISNASLNSNIINASVTTNPLIKSVGAVTPVTNLANGASFYPTFNMGNLAIYDEVFVTIESANSIIDSYAYQFLLMRNSTFSGQEVGYAPTPIPFVAQTITLAKYYTSKPAKLLDQALGDIIELQFINISGATIVSDTLSIYVYCRYASSSIDNTPSVTLSGTNTVNIGNSPAVTVTSGNISISGTPNVSISGTPAVTVNSGSISISGTPSVNINNTSIAIKNEPSGTIQVGGTINIGNTPAVTISGTPTVNIGNTPSVSISGTPNVAISSGTVNATISNAQLNSNVINSSLSVNPLVPTTLATVTVNNLANNAIQTVILPIGFGLYDEMIVTYTSSSSITASYTLTLSEFLNTVLGNNTSSANLNQLFVSLQQSSSYFVSTPLKFTNVSFGNVVVISFKNVSGATIVSDTLTVYGYCRYASASIDNPSTAPVQSQQSTGSFDSIAYFNVGLGASNPTTQTLLASGGYIKYIAITINDTNTSLTETWSLDNGGSHIDEQNINFSTTQHFDYDFRNGVPNNAITVSGILNSGHTLFATGYIIYTSKQIATPVVNTLI